MNIDFNKSLTFKQFETAFLEYYNNDVYNEILDMGTSFSCKIKDKIINTSPKYNAQISPKQKLHMVTDKLQTSCSKCAFYKNLVVINSVFNNDLFLEMLNRNNIDIELFIDLLNKTIILNKLTKKNFQNEYVENALNNINRHFGFDRSLLYILKIYELKILKDLELKDIHKKTK